jgi:hypothetical protein
MKRIATTRLGILQGSPLLFSDFADGGAMWTGTGQRDRRFAVLFSEPFAEAPAVTVGIALWDVDTHGILRAEIRAENVTPAGFDIVFSTWGDSRVARIRADWMAIGPVSDDDLWELY